MAGIKFEMKTKDLRARIARFQNDFKPRDYMKNVGQAWLREIDQTFKREGRKNERRWKSLSPKTIKYRRKGSSTILQDTGTLKNSFVSHTTQRMVRVGTNIHYAASHEFGRTSKYGKEQPPQRPMLPTIETAEDIAEKVGEGMVRIAAKRFNR